ncbi:MAG TPA: hypothetical protein PK200_01240 [Spirochaetota bacterium]|nr:hypothetical protein [Spirochaetota bacterium]
MIELGKLYDVKILKTLELLKLMLDEKHIDEEKLIEVTLYLIYMKDLPKNFKSDYRRIFSKDPPVN